MRPTVVILASRTGLVPEATLREIERFGLPVISSVDGSLGYAKAVQHGFARAAEAGCTHAITLDVDMQHSPADVPAFVDAIRAHPAALITGVRKLPPGRLPWPVKLGAVFCDFWIWSATGRWTHDCCHANRAYPLAAVSEFTCRSIGYEFELEVLVKAIWCDIATVPQPVRVPTDFRIVFIPPVPFVRFGWLITTLLLRRLLLPTPLLGRIHSGEFGELNRTARLVRIAKETVAHHCDHPVKFAAAVGLGVFFGVSPAWGFQMILAASFAHLLRLSKAVMVAASNISFPLTIPFLLYASLMIGHLLHHGEFAGLPRPDQFSKEVVLRFLGEYIAGSLVLGASMGTVAASLAYVAARAVKSRRENTSSNHSE